MTLKYTLAASALALGICMAAPAYAQQASNSQTGAIAGLSAIATTTSTDLNMQDSNNDNSTNVADSGNDNSDNSTNVADSGNTSDSGNTALMFALGSFNSDSSDNSTNNSNNGNDSSSIVAAQTLVATVTNNAPVGSALFQVGSDNKSGANSVNGNAFAAYAGILNNSWNTGINSSAQAATNVAARGSVTFGN